MLPATVAALTASLRVPAFGMTLRVRDRAHAQTSDEEERMNGIFRTLARALFHAVAISLICLAFAFSLFLGLQVEPRLGNAGIALTVVLAAAYVWFGLVRRK